ncbi:MAG: NAD(P)/FAD-dependent oxidoreductase [Oscillochloridaceae bacterium umkhey_bin13]
MYDLVIIGGGAASQAAAMYAHGKQIDFLLISDRIGGRVEPIAAADFDYSLGNILIHFDYPDAEEEERQLIGSSAVRLFERQLSRQVGRVLSDQVMRVEKLGQHFLVQTLQAGPIAAATVIVATGAAPRRLTGVPGAELVQGLGHGRTSRAADVADKSVAVIGDSEQALYSAADLASRARQVALVLPNAPSSDSVPLSLVQRRPNIELFPGFQVHEVRPLDEGCELLLVCGEQRLNLIVDAAFADLGCEPASSLVGHMARTSADGFIQVDRGFATSVSGLFAAGDVTHPEGEQVLAAIGDGARAARSAHFYLLTRPRSRMVGAAGR